MEKQKHGNAFKYNTVCVNFSGVKENYNLLHLLQIGTNNTHLREIMASYRTSEVQYIK